MEKPDKTPTPAPDTEHMASQVVVQKKSRKSLYVILAVVVALFVAIAAGLYTYKVAVLDPQAAKAESDAKAAAAKKKELTPEEKISATLTDNLNKQIEALKQNDDTKYIKNSSAAAQSVGRNLHEQDLKD